MKFIEIYCLSFIIGLGLLQFEFEYWNNYF